MARDYFYKRFEEVFKNKYIADFGKDGALFKQVLGVIPLEDLRPLIDIYLTTPDEFSEKVGYTVGLFKKRINSLRVGRAAQRLGDKGLKAVVAGQNWLDKKEVLDVKP